MVMMMSRSKSTRNDNWIVKKNPARFQRRRNPVIRRGRVADEDWLSIQEQISELLGGVGWKILG
jgi:hypothetical protein